MEKQFPGQPVLIFSVIAKLLATVVSATNVKVEEANENVEINDINPDVINDGITDENEGWEKESLHTEIPGNMNVVSVFEDARIR